ncbi:TetR family transcriptional regulator [Epidermidibacterium keratini]|uniref:TetR family transcriptional regulator n=1 Tax=Epidermidibacterium keratini TaxID=1891644 RepID=A0A7L4YKV1_9ACTN|nr:TetR/AcrR family transcriptional regulator [Epidermidibacterium keratini]QHB99176.1 TetR family transcriptional regulator [Epidermidibacterium keratini]
MSATSSYHHGDLPATLVRSAIEMLDEDGDVELSLRGVARRAGVSSAAPYRHFPDRTALLSAVAAVGYQQLMISLATEHPEPSSADDLADLAVAYVDFALTRPGLFRVMFTEGCDRTIPDRVAAVEAIHAYLGAAVTRLMKTDAPEAVATAMWSLVHGLAFLHLDGKLDASPREAVAARVRETVLAMLAARVR